MELTLFIYQIFLLIGVAFLGGCLASFWQVVCTRGCKHQPWWRGRSRCDHCSRQLCWWENIPLLSYPLLGGRCRTCRGKIPLVYWGWEVFLGGCFAGFVICYQQQLLSLGLDFSLPLFLELCQSWLWWCLLIVLCWVSWVDLLTKQIANGWLVVLAVIAALIFFLDGVRHHWQFLISRLPAIAVVLSLLVLGYYLLNFFSQRIWHQQGFGSGDVWVLAILAAVLSTKQFLSLLLLSFWSGAAVGIVYLWVNKCPRIKGHKPTIAFLPFITLALPLSYWWGEALIGYLLLI